MYPVVKQTQYLYLTTRHSQYYTYLQTYWRSILLCTSILIGIILLGTYFHLHHDVLDQMTLMYDDVAADYRSNCISSVPIHSKMLSVDNGVLFHQKIIRNPDEQGWLIIEDEQQIALYDTIKLPKPTTCIHSKPSILLLQQIPIESLLGTSSIVTNEYMTWRTSLCGQAMEFLISQYEYVRISVTFEQYQLSIRTNETLGHVVTTTMEVPDPGQCTAPFVLTSALPVNTKYFRISLRFWSPRRIHTNFIPPITIPHLRAFLNNYWFRIQMMKIQHTSSPSIMITAQPILFMTDLLYTFSIVWESNCNIVVPHVLLGYSYDILTYETDRSHQLAEIHIETVVVSDVVYVHRATVQLRDPSKHIYYRVSNGNMMSDIYPVPDTQVHTDSPTKIALIGDTQSSARFFRHHVRHIQQHEPDLLIHVGDMVQDGNNIKEWRTYFTAPLEVAYFGSTVPSVVSRGNHDGETNLAYVYVYNPGNQAYYAFTKGDIRFIVLNTNLDPNACEHAIDPNAHLDIQTNWLIAQLSDPDTIRASFRVIIVHIPPYVEYWDPNTWNKGEQDWGKFVREKWLPLLKNSNVGIDLIISGHSHIYQRGSKDGITYAVIGGGGGELEQVTQRVEDWNVYQTTLFEHHYILLTSTTAQSRSRGSLRMREQRMLVWEAYNLQDQIIDTFTIMAQIQDEL